MWAPGQDISRGDVSCQTHFFRKKGAGVAKRHLVGWEPFLVGGPGHVPSLHCPKSGSALYNICIVMCIIYAYHMDLFTLNGIAWI